jgi:murein L,D-transpeptidase YcbB/YkuD
MKWLRQALGSDETQIAPLAKPMPIYLTYFTSWVDIEGNIHFRPDVYQRDTALMLVMGGEIEHVTAHHRSRTGNPPL